MQQASGTTTAGQSGTTGSTARAVLTSGPLSVNEPPNGSGRYDTQVTVSTWTDSQTSSTANWLLHMVRNTSCNCGVWNDIHAGGR